MELSWTNEPGGLYWISQSWTWCISPWCYCNTTTILCVLTAGTNRFNHGCFGKMFLANVAILTGFRHYIQWKSRSGCLQRWRNRIAAMGRDGNGQYPECMHACMLESIVNNLEPEAGYDAYHSILLEAMRPLLEGSSMGNWTPRLASSLASRVFQTIQ